MTIRRRCLLLGMLFTSGITACDPVAGILVRQRLSPVPSRDCVQASLQSTRLITDTRDRELLRGERGYALTLFLPDSASRRGLPMPPMLTMLAAAPDTAELQLRILYFGALPSSLDSTRVQRLVDLARPI